jgi:hypothetical protein
MTLSAEPQAPTAAIEAPTVDTEPLREIHVEPLVEPLPGDAAYVEAAPAAPSIMDKDQFWNFFASTFVFAGNAFAAVPPLNSPLQSLVRAPNHDGARPASDEIYDLAQKHQWLRWIIEDTTKDFRALVVIGAFGLAIGGAVRNELRARNVTVAQIARGNAGRMHSDEAPPPRDPDDSRVAPAKGAPMADDVRA